MTLDRALMDAGIRAIDYLSIDVEGAEWEILSAFPFREYRIDVLGVEDNFGNFPLDRLNRLMATHGFERVGRIGTDNFYRHIGGATGP